jgi:hypothetical protein
VALAAEVVGFLKGDQVAVGQPQYIPVIRIMAVKAPALLTGMVEHFRNFNMLVFQYPSFRIDVHIRMALGAGEDVL